MTKIIWNDFEQLCWPERVSIMDDTNILSHVRLTWKIRQPADFINAFPGIYPLGQLHHSAVQNDSRAFCEKDVSNHMPCWMKKHWLLAWPMLT
jgi:hypothetical protein